MKIWPCIYVPKYGFRSVTLETLFLKIMTNSVRQRLNLVHRAGTVIAAHLLNPSAQRAALVCKSINTVMLLNLNERVAPSAGHQHPGPTGRQPRAVPGPTAPLATKHTPAAGTPAPTPASFRDRKTCRLIDLLQTGTRSGGVCALSHR